MNSLSSLQAFAYTLAMAKQYGGWGDTQTREAPASRRDLKANATPRRPEPTRSWVDEFHARASNGG